MSGARRDMSTILVHQGRSMQPASAIPPNPLGSLKAQDSHYRDVLVKSTTSLTATPPNTAEIPQGATTAWLRRTACRRQHSAENSPLSIGLDSGPFPFRDDG